MSATLPTMEQREVLHLPQLGSSGGPSTFGGAAQRPRSRPNGMRPKTRDRGAVQTAAISMDAATGDRELVCQAMAASRRANPRRAGASRAGGKAGGARKPRKKASPEPEPEVKPRVRLGGPPAMERARKGQPVLNTSAAKSSRAILRMVCKQMDWWEENLANDRGTVFWIVSNDDIAERLPRRKPSQRMARYAGMYELCKKVPFARMMRAAQERNPERFKFWPRTWIFPDDNERPSAANFRAGHLIFKPVRPHALYRHNSIPTDVVSERSLASAGRRMPRRRDLPAEHRHGSRADLGQYKGRLLRRPALPRRSNAFA